MRLVVVLTTKVRQMITFPTKLYALYQRLDKHIEYEARAHIIPMLRAVNKEEYKHELVIGLTCRNARAL